MFTFKKHQTHIFSTSRPTSISDLDDDTLAEIISRSGGLANIKHMVSSQVVSKLWHRVISQVCLPQLTTLSPVFGLIFNTSVGEPWGCPWNLACINTLHDKKNTSCLQTCFNILPVQLRSNDLFDCSNGLLLYYNSLSRLYFVCNPSTRQFNVFHKAPCNYAPKASSLISDPQSVYKVVYIERSAKKMDMLVMHVFSPTTEKWTKHYLTVEPCINGSLWSVRYHFFDGSLYTLSICGHLLKFDLQLSCCRAIELPHVVVEAASIGCLGVSQGSLHYSWSDGQSSMTMRVWMLKVDEWVLKRTICLQYFYKHPLCSNFSSASCFSVFGFHPTSDILFVGNFGGIFCYDPCLNRLESICRSAQDKPMYRIPDFVFLFSVNLIPLEMSKWILGE